MSDLANYRRSRRLNGLQMAEANTGRLTMDQTGHRRSRPKKTKPSLPCEEGVPEEIDSSDISDQARKAEEKTGRLKGSVAEEIDSSDMPDQAAGRLKGSVPEEIGSSAQLVEVEEKTGRLIVPEEIDSSDSPLRDMAQDGWKLIKAVLRLLRMSYPVWKWALLACIVFLVIWYFIWYLWVAAHTALCGLPMSSWVKFCTNNPTPSVDVTKLATSQKELTIVMDQVGRGFDLARDMVGHEFAVRDLRIRVVASKLARKEKLTRELKLLIQQTKQAAK